MSASCRLARIDNRLKVFPRTETRFSWFQQLGSPDESFPSGIEAETAECLYGLVAITKPNLILETGTRLGISTRIMSLALSDWNPAGKIMTIERCGQCIEYLRDHVAPKYLNIELHAGESLAWDIGEIQVDMLYLDSEPCYRYQELVKFWPNVRDEGLIVVHDLYCVDSPAFAPVPELVREKLAAGELSALTFRTDSGLTIFQKKPKLWGNHE